MGQGSCRADGFISASPLLSTEQSLFFWDPTLGTDIAPDVSHAPSLSLFFISCWLCRDCAKADPCARLRVLFLKPVCPISKRATEILGRLHQKGTGGRENGHMRQDRTPRREGLRGHGLISPGQDQVLFSHMSFVHMLIIYKKFSAPLIWFKNSYLSVSHIVIYLAQEYHICIYHI